MTVVENQEADLSLSAWLWFNKLVKKLRFKVVDMESSAKKLGKVDPRRIVHSLKVGLAITLVSLFYYFEPKFDHEGFGVSVMWDVLTIVVVLEFSVGATLGRAVNRGIATFLGGSLAVGAHRLACFSGSKTFEPIVLGIFLFSTGESTECGHVLKELALAMKTVTYPLTIKVHIENAKVAAENLKSLLQTNSSWEEINFSEIIPIATVASLLIDVVSYMIKMVESFDQLSTLARFKKTNRFALARTRTGSWKRKRVMPEQNTESVHHHVIAVE